ncbi:MAG TPA: hypothetical protein VLY04_02850 [Bryobacteraceae bacterium]|nr:hypothetical protein [Bryobacteraceae bacterium]
MPTKTEVTQSARRRKLPARKNSDCPICLIPHDDEIHAATLRIREWVRDRLAGRIDDAPTSWDRVA